MLRRLRTDERGLAAVEFALLAPVMLLTYCGLAEMTMAIMAERRAAHVASVVGDLVAQSPTGSISAAQLTDIYTVGGSIMTPFPSTAMKLRITSVVADPSGVPRVAWSQGNGMTPLTVNSTPSGFPPTLLSAGDSVIETDMQYSYTSPLRITLPTALSFGESFYLKPRQAASIAYTG
ncbi:TadE/TadG family type IV pilus assembly protein [Phenylobacterium sp.]|uniref:TadE/TadG family type IV pilus assembly protein n=1 Tax=Phenylobacterium sp. TaxID=1871053 RepID=UPI0011F6474A|nr:TadE/TadG family type IV pilus assembly protein [Phenylobacterium sp.]THD60467.1 MAG: pilus assembly protein [Phenylobacterium sp.]